MKVKHLLLIGAVAVAGAVAGYYLYKKNGKVEIDLEKYLSKGGKRGNGANTNNN